MPGLDDKSLDGEDSLEPPSPSNSLNSVHFQMHLYPYASQLAHQQQPIRSKRRQVKNACTNCQKACKKCDDARPCLRCVKYGISEECVDSQRKERKKGIKRGPYKKRDGKDRAGSNVVPVDVPDQGHTVSNSVPSLNQGGSPIPASYIPLGYAPGFYPQYTHNIPKPGEPGPAIYSAPPYYLAPHPQVQSVQDADPNGYPPPQAFYPAVFAPAPYQHPHYGSIPRSDVHNSIHLQYPTYVSAPYHKHAEITHGSVDRLHQDTTKVAGKAG